MNIRKATLNDIAELVELWAEIMNYHVGHNPMFVLVENYKELVPAMLEERMKKETVFITEEESNVTGMIILRTEELPPVLPFKKRGYIAETIVKEQYRSKGIGEALVQHATTFLKKQNCDVIGLQVSSKNPEGIKFWERMGFEVGTWYMLKPLT